MIDALEPEATSERMFLPRDDKCPAKLIDRRGPRPGIMHGRPDAFAAALENGCRVACQQVGGQVGGEVSRRHCGPESKLSAPPPERSC
jgi:hypothetical protein